MGQHFTLGAGPVQIMGQHVLPRLYGCRRLWFSGVRQAEDNIRFHRFLYELEMTWFYHLGIHLDADATISCHVAKTVSSCFSVLRQLRSIRRSVTRPVLQSLVVSLVLARIGGTTY